MWLALGAVIAGLLVLVWSADRFVDGASATARHAGMPTLLVGMLVIGFGTSAPEMVVSALASVDGNPGLALGNAYGSNITNIALILGVVALLSPISVHSSVLRRELPVLAVVMLLAGYQLYDGQVSHMDAVVSVDAIKRFKPDPAVYAYLRTRLETRPEATWLVSSNPFDVIGATHAGLRSAWIRRHSDAPFDPWGIEPDMTVPELETLADRMMR